jgi:hypothetical protein
LPSSIHEGYTSDTIVPGHLRKQQTYLSCLLGFTAVLMMVAVRTSETSVDNLFTRQYNPEDSSEQQTYCCTAEQDSVRI